MPQFLISEPAEAILDSLRHALNLVNVGILLLNRDLQVRFINSHQIELFGLSPALLASGPTFRDLLDHAGVNGWFAVAEGDLPNYLNQREAAVRQGSVLPTQIILQSGMRLLFSCVPCSDGGRILTYSDISRELQREASDTTNRIRADIRYQTETLEDQAAYLVSLAEAADESARSIEAARVSLEEKIAEHRQLEAELRLLARTDGLTGVLNRTAFLISGQQSLEQGNHLAVLMLDVDHFKSINDRYGHAGGDLALQHLAATLCTATREDDLLGRLGGEEFAVLLPDVSSEESIVIAERIRRQIAGATCVFGDTLIEMTVSVGVALQRPTDAKIAQIIARADAALYRAKGGGRNRVEKEQTVAV